MKLEDLSEMQKRQIHDAACDKAAFPWKAIADILNVEASEAIFTQERLMDACGLEACEGCGWILSRETVTFDTDNGFYCPMCTAEMEGCCNID